MTTRFPERRDTTVMEEFRKETDRRLGHLEAELEKVQKTCTATHENTAELVDMFTTLKGGVRVGKAGVHVMKWLLIVGAFVGGLKLFLQHWLEK